jgi:hypothetical protein
MVLGIGAATAAPAFANAGATGSCGSSDLAGGGQVLGGTINKNIDVPAGKYCSLQWAEVTGNVSAEGALSATGTVFNRNVAVSGPVSVPVSELSLFNYASHIKGNLSVT